MTTLSDVNTRRGESRPPDIGFAPNVIPETNSSRTGVSVRYALDENKKWFVLRATYGRANKVYDIIQKDGQEAYIPLGYQLKEINGKKKRVKAPLLPNLVFVYTTEDYVKSLTKNPAYRTFVSFYFNHFSTDRFGKNPPLTIDYAAMINFINLTSIDDKHIRIVDPCQCNYKSGELVRVIDGKFKGVIGRVARAAGEQRVVVELEGLCWVATAYIPTAFLQACIE